MATFTGTNANENIVGSPGADSLNGAGGNDTVSGLDGDDILFGGSGDDLLDGGRGSDIVDGGDGTDTVWIESDYWDVTITQPSAGVTRMVRTAGSLDVSFANVEQVSFRFFVVPLAYVLARGAVATEDNDLLVDPTPGTDTIAGLGGNDTIRTYYGLDLLLGGEGNDSLQGEYVRATLEGGPGDDTLRGRDSGSGVLVSYASSPVGVVANLLTGTASDGFGGTDFLQFIGGLADSPFDDWLIGRNNGFTLFELGAGNDTIDGSGFYTEQVMFPQATAPVRVDLALGTASGASIGNDRLIGIEYAIGTPFDDTLIGGAGARLLEGGAGDDRLELRTGVTVGLVGGDGHDTAVFPLPRASYRIWWDGVYYLEGASIEYVDFEEIESYQFADQLLSHAQLEAQAGRLFNGDSGPETTTGSAAGDQIWALSGDDLASGLAGDDRIDGSFGNDTLFGGEGDDSLDSGPGTDSVDGGPGSDTLALWLSGTNRPDMVLDLLAGTAIAGVHVTTFTSIENAEAARFEATVLRGDNAANRLVGSDFQDTIEGRDGNDTLVGGHGSDNLAGGAGVDELSYADTGSSLADLPVTIDLLTGIATQGSETDTIGGFENVTGTSTGNDVITGDNGPNLLQGLGGVDRLDGGAGNDWLRGGEGIDLLTGNLGNDLLEGGPFNDPDGRDFNAAVYAESASAVQVDLQAGSAAGGAGNDTLMQIDAIYASAHADILSGSDRADRHEAFAGGAGADTIDGRAGGDLLRYDFFVNGTTPVTVDLELGSATDNFGDLDVFTNIEGVIGTQFADLLLGHESAEIADTLSGLAGNDTLNGRGGERDEVTYWEATSGVIADLAAQAASSDGFGASDVLLGIERIVGGRFDDQLTGDGADNTLTGANGNDTLTGAGGDDQLVPGTGLDSVDGGAGLDSVILRLRRAEYRVDKPSAAETVLADAFGNEVRLVGIESVVFDDGSFSTTEVRGELPQPTPGDDTLTGDDLPESIDALAGNDSVDGAGGDDTLTGGPGDDTLEGGAGWDRLDYAGASGAVILDMATGVVSGAAGNDAVSGFEEVDGSHFADRMTAAASPPGSYGSGLWGLQGDDTLIGGTGDDDLTGGEGNDSLTGGGGLNRLRGGPGNDTIDNAGGSIDGGVNYDSAGAGVDVNLALGSASDGDGGTDTLRQIAFVLGSSYADRIVGDAAANRFEGGDGDDTLEGGAGNDSLYAGPGADRLIPGSGQDVVEGGVGSPAVVVLPLARSAYAVTWDGQALRLAAGSDSVSARLVGSFEFADGSASFDAVRSDAGLLIEGDAGSNSLNGGGGADTLRGFAGDDTLTGLGGNDSLDGLDGDDRLVPGAGDDTLDGGAGQDLAVLGFARASYDVQVVDDALLLMHSGGDRVRLASVENVQFADQTLAAATLAAQAGSSVNGTTGDDRLGGTSGHDTLRGLGGDDHLSGGPGNDQLDAGPGHYDWLTGGPGNDTLDGGATAEGFLGVDIVIYEGSAPLTANLQAGVGSQDGYIDTLIQVDAIFSGSGHDSLRGADGPATQRGDTLRGGGGDDTIDGGTGVDTSEWIGLSSQYTVAQLNASTWSVTDNDTTNGNEGTDRITNIERLVFSDQMLSLGTRAEEVARVAFILWSPGIIVSTALFSRGLSFYDVGYDFPTLCATALQFWTGERDAQLVQRLLDNSGSTRTPAEMLQVIIDNGGAESIAGRATAVAQIAMDAATTGLIEQSGIRISGLLSDHFVQGFGNLFGLLPGEG